MKKAIFWLAILLCTSCRKDLVRWRSVEKIETFTAEDRFNKVFFENDSIGFVIGGKRFDRSTILRTTNGGKSWTYRNLPEAPKALYGIATAPSGTLFITGFDGKLLKSQDQGQSWQLYQMHYLPFKDLALVTDSMGIAIGGISFYEGYTTIFSADGKYEAFDSLGYELNDIEMVDAKNGYIAGYGILLKTRDGGQNWRMLSAANDNFTAVHAYDNGEVWTCGYNGSIFHSFDGGESWDRMRDGNNIIKTRYHLLDILFTDAMHGYAVGENGIFIYTDDGGRHWLEFEKFTDNDLLNLAAMKDGSLFVCGDGGALYRVYPRHFQ